MVDTKEIIFRDEVPTTVIEDITAGMPTQPGGRELQAPGSRHATTTTITITITTTLFLQRAEISESWKQTRPRCGKTRSTSF